MGTRGAYGFRLNGEDLVTYNHWDSYPAGLGRDVVSFIQAHGVDDLRHIASKVELVDADQKPTSKQVVACAQAGLVDLGVSRQSIDDWYCLLRNAQGDLNALAKVPYMMDYHKFLLDSLWCEWAYIINLDTEMLEVYKGLNKDPNAVGRYAALKRDDEFVDDVYYGVALIDEVSLESIPAASDIVIEKLIEYWNKVAEEE